MADLVIILEEKHQQDPKARELTQRCVNLCAKNIKSVITTLDDLSAVRRGSTVVVCGAEPAKKLLSDKSIKITEKAGIVVQSNVNGAEVDVVMQLSPGYVIREMNQKGGKSEKVQRLWIDVWSMVHDILGGSVTEAPETVEYKTPRDAAALLERLCKLDTVVAYDYETWGDVSALRPELCTDFRIVSVGLAWREDDGEIHNGAFLFDRPGRASTTLSAVWEKFLRRKTKNVAHYAKYEHKCNIKRFKFSHLCHDTILQLNALDELADGKLDRVMARCNVHWGAFKTEFGDTRITPMTAPIDQLLRYNALDAHATLLCFEFMEAELTEKGERLRKIARQNEVICMDLAEQEMDGMYIDAKELAAQKKRVVVDCEKAEVEFQSLKPVRAACHWAVENIKSCRKEDPETLRFNPKSVPMMHRLLFDELKVPRSKLSTRVQGEIKIKARKDDLKPLERDYPIIKDLNKVRSLKSMATMLEAYQNFMSTSGCVHTSYGQTTVVTGRLNSTSPPLQNIPKKDPIRAIFASRFGDEGLVISADYAQQEPRLIAGWSGDRKMIHALVTGLDLHAFVGAMIFDRDYDDIVARHTQGENVLEREVGKRMNLGIAYGQTEYGLSDKTGASIQTAQMWLRKYDERFPGITKWRQEFHKQAWMNGYVEDLFGGRRHLPDAQSGDKWKRERANRQAGNFPIQGTAYRFTQIAIHSTKALFREGCKGLSLVVGQVHDSIIVDTHRSMYHEAVKRLRSGMLVHNRMPYWKDRGCPMKVDISVGRNLRDLVPEHRLEEIW